MSAGGPCDSELRPGLSSCLGDGPAAATFGAETIPRWQVFESTSARATPGAPAIYGTCLHEQPWYGARRGQREIAIFLGLRWLSNARCPMAGSRTSSHFGSASEQVLMMSPVRRRIARIAVASRPRRRPGHYTLSIKSADYSSSPPRRSPLIPNRGHRRILGCQSRNIGGEDMRPRIPAKPARPVLAGGRQPAKV
jgi:hypothetical protein